MKATHKIILIFGALFLVAIFGTVTLGAGIFIGQHYLTPPPCTVQIRKALLGPGYAVDLHNTSGDPVRYHVHVSNGDQTKDMVWVVDGFQTQAMGYEDNWPFTKGDMITVACDGHAPKTWRIN